MYRTSMAFTPRKKRKRKSPSGKAYWDRLGYNKSILVNVKKETHMRLKTLANKNRRSLQMETLYIIEEALDRAGV